MITHKKKFGVYHWDTFDNETILIKDFESFAQAEEFIRQRYGKRVSGNGADRVEVVDQNGNIIAKYSVT